MKRDSLDTLPPRTLADPARIRSLPQEQWPKTALPRRTPRTGLSLSPTVLRKLVVCLLIFIDRRLRDAAPATARTRSRGGRVVGCAAYRSLLDAPLSRWK